MRLSATDREYDWQDEVDSRSSAVKKRLRKKTQYFEMDTVRIPGNWEFLVAITLSKGERKYCDEVCASNYAHKS